MVRMAKQRRSRVHLLAFERAELQRRLATQTGSQSDSYRAEIILRAAGGQTDAQIAEALGFTERTVWMWRRRFAQQRLEGLKNHPKTTKHRGYNCQMLDKLLMLARQNPADLDVTRTGQTHWTIKGLMQYIGAHPELGLGAPSKSTIGVMLKRRNLHLDRL
jgi:transposase